MILVAFLGAVYINSNYAIMTNDILKSEQSIANNNLKSSIKIENVTINPTNIIVYVYNNGSETLSSANVDLYINDLFIPRNVTTINVIDAENSSSWVYNSNITIAYNQTLKTGDRITVACESGKEDSVVI